MATLAKTWVIDSDAHVIESEHTWDYLLPHEERFRPKLFINPDNPNQAHWVIGGKVRGHRNATPTQEQLQKLSNQVGRDLVSSQDSRELSDVSQRLQHMDELGIDVQVLHNTMWIEPVTDVPEADVALCGSWNRWMADVWQQAGGRLRWCAVMPTLDIEAAVEQTRYVREHGAVAIALRPMELGRTLVDPYFYPLYAEAEKLDLAVAIHISNGSSAMMQALRSPFDRSGGFTPFRIPTVMECGVIMTSEVPERFPTLRWGFVEASSNWVPWVVREVKQRFIARNLGAPPENVLKHFNVYVTCEVSDDIPFVLKHGGEDNILIGTDYGHTDTSSAMDAIRTFMEMDDVSDEAKAKILYDNPRALYGL